jgi:hypothetical protein
MGSTTETFDMVQSMPVEQVERLYSRYKKMGDELLGQHESDENGNLILTGQGGRQSQANDPNANPFKLAPIPALPSRGIDLGVYSSQGSTKTRRH